MSRPDSLQIVRHSLHLSKRARSVLGIGLPRPDAPASSEFVRCVPCAPRRDLRLLNIAGLGFSRPPPPTLVEARTSSSRAVASKLPCRLEARASASTLRLSGGHATLSAVTKAAGSAGHCRHGRLSIFVEVISHKGVVGKRANLRKHRALSFVEFVIRRLSGLSDAQCRFA